MKDINVELKVLPLRKIGNQIQPKERSKIKSINYNKIVNEEWGTSDVRKKMEKILFLLYEHPTGKTFKDWEEFQFKGTLLYEVKKENIVQEDWEQIKVKVKSDVAHTISEGDSKILGACTSGTGKELTYGNKNITAKQRSYSLKHNYLKVFYEENKEVKKFSSLNLDKKIEPQDFVLNQFNNVLKGNSLKLLVDKFNVKFSPTAKSSFSLLISRILQVDDNKKIRELEENGIVIKTIPVNNQNKPWEAMSFPKFSLVDLVEEDWDSDENEADFKNIISQGYIFIPIIKEKEKYTEKGKIKYRFKDWTTWQIGESVFWKANSAELLIIKQEWEKAKGAVKRGIQVSTIKYGSGNRQENNLLKSSATQIIHIRPHANNSKDIDKPYLEYSKNKVRISWQSFWLNKKFTEKIINKII